MAVYTTVSVQQAQAMFDGLGLGTVRSLQGIASGIENTNYFVQANSRWVLTVFERLEQPLLDYALALMQHLAAHGLPVPAPATDAQGRLWRLLQGKPAAVVARLAGQSITEPSLAHRALLGQSLAKMHLAGAGFALKRPHPRGLPWWQATAGELNGRLPAAMQALLGQELAFQAAQAAALQALPSGPIHADLFRDNVLFDEGDASALGEGPTGPLRLSGLFDFYFAGDGPLVFDLAVCLNDWCLDPNTQLPDPKAMRELTDAYSQQRPLSAAEVAALPAALRAAALRFWLSRLHDAYQPRPAALLQPKDPMHFQHILRWHVQQPH